MIRLKEWCLVGVLMLVLVGCTTATRRAMREADVALTVSLQQTASSEWEQAVESTEKLIEHVRQGIAARPVRRGATGEDLDMQPLLATFEAGPVKNLKAALNAKDRGAAFRAYKEMRGQCLSCHALVGRTDIVVSELEFYSVP